jgi:hypothetical protein
MLRIDRPPSCASREHSGRRTISSFAILRQQTSVRRRLGLFSAKRRCCSADKAGRAIAQRNVDGQCENARRRKHGVSEKSVPVPWVFSFHRAIAKTNQKGQSQERREPDQAAKLENEKRNHNAKDQDDQSRVETDPGHRSSPRRLARLRRSEGPRSHSSASIGSGVARARAFTGRRRKSGT